MNKRTILILSAAALTAGLSAACTPWGAEVREITAERIARPAFMVERKIEAKGLHFQLWERMHEEGAPVNIYIEGDGDTDADYDGTPANPVGLHLASRDNAENLGWIGRPCQFQEVPDDKKCAPKNWSTDRFSPEIIAAYNEILDEMVKRYDLKGINLIGYDGGANIAAAIAAERSDVLTLRTVAGDLTPDMLPPNTTKKSPAKTRLGQNNVRAGNVAPQISGLPQRHFIGGLDEITPQANYRAFRSKMGETGCIHETIVPDADHTRGWVEKWPQLLKEPVTCPTALEDPLKDYSPAAFPPVPQDIDHGQK